MVRVVVGPLQGDVNPSTGPTSAMSRHFPGAIFDDVETARRSPIRVGRTAVQHAADLTAPMRAIFFLAIAASFGDVRLGRAEIIDRDYTQSKVYCVQQIPSPLCPYPRRLFPEQVADRFGRSNRSRGISSERARTVRRSPNTRFPERSASQRPP